MYPLRWFSVYDPNVTNDKIRIISESKEDIKHYSLMDFMM
ncbi:ShET2/EspL2 family type III secretion system effector toxin [Shigella flexneri]